MAPKLLLVVWCFCLSDCLRSVAAVSPKRCRLCAGHRSLLVRRLFSSCFVRVDCRGIFTLLHACRPRREEKKRTSCVLLHKISCISPFWFPTQATPLSRGFRRLSHASYAKEFLRCYLVYISLLRQSFATPQELFVDSFLLLFCSLRGGERGAQPLSTGNEGGWCRARWSVCPRVKPTRSTNPRRCIWMKGHEIDNNEFIKPKLTPSIM